MNIRTPISHSVAKQIQEMIQTGEIPVSERLPSQRILSERLGVSRPSLREALMTLETLGMVQTFPGRGTFVTDPKAKQHGQNEHWRYSQDHVIKDVYEVRLLIEERLARHAAQTCTSQDIKILKQATDKMEEAWSREDLVATVGADAEFHQHIANKSTNSLLLQTYNVASNLFIETQRQPIPFTPVDRMKLSVAEHRKIIDAIVNRDPDSAAVAMSNHIRNTARFSQVNEDEDHI